MSKIPAISLRSQWLGEKLRDARLRSGYTMREAAEYLQTDHTTLGRFERGTHKMRRAYVKDLVDFYSVTDNRERDMLIRLAEDAWRKDWWDGDDSGLETGFIDFTWLEGRATGIRAFEPLLIHGLLQTPEYAEALKHVGYGYTTPPEETERIAEVRATRQQILIGENPTKLTVVLEEPALHRVIGGHAVHTSQLQHLLDQAARPNITILVLSREAVWDPGHHGPFIYFEMPDPYPEIAYIENLSGRTFLEVEAKVQRFRHTYDELERLALSPRKSIAFMQNVLKELE